MKKIVVLVCAHRKYQMPEDGMYFPVHCGAEGKESIGFTGDNTGENISLKNAYYSELTGLYWGWKNLDCQYLGIAHYRRHLSRSGAFLKPAEARFDCVLSQKEAEQLLKETDLILPKKRNYYIENLYSHYVHTLQAEPLDMTGEIIREK